MRSCLAPFVCLLLLATAVPVSAQTAFDASFSPKPGNSWWVETSVQANQPLAAVEARANGGQWVPLARTDWGTWAKSFHVPDGSIVEFLARSTGGATDVSDRYRWPGATRVTDSTPPPPSLTFDHRGGNEWWIEVALGGASANQVSAVRAQDLGADGVETGDDDSATLTKRSWGVWSGGLHVEPGQMVRFFATVGGGQVASCRFSHPSGEEHCGTPPPPAVDVAFGPKAGNAWWVETFAMTGARDDVKGVDARANGGPWRPLALRSWGAWAGSFSVPDGSVVEFRAATGSGQDVSDRFVWPGAVPVGSSGSWPEEGSYVDYDLQQGVADMRQMAVDATFVFHSGQWRYECEGTRHGEPFFEASFAAPPFGALRTQQPEIRPIQVGDDVQVNTFFTCDFAIDDLRVMETHTHDTRNDGKTVAAQFWYGQTADDGCGGCNYHDADWDKSTGLVAWFHDGGTGWSWGQMQDTDAPLQRA